MVLANGTASKQRDDQLIEASVRYSVQTEQPAYYGAGMTSYGYLGEYAYSLPSVYNPYRQALLSRLALHPQNGMWLGAVSGLIKQVVSTSWEVKGKRRVKYFQDVLLDAEYGDGWDSFLQKILWDFLNCDDGAVIQVIGRGNPDTYLPRELVTGISHLDVYRCYFTGNAEFPVWYQDAVTGKLHKLHASRVVRLVDQPLGDPLLRGRGICALSRAWTYIQQEITAQTYIGESLDSSPPPGILLVNGAQPKSWDDAWALYKAALRQQGETRYKPIVEYVNEDTGKVVTIEFIRFSTKPDGWDFDKAEQSRAIGMARALNIDPQDIMPISGGSFGTNTQSRVLDKKAAGKMLAHIVKLLERKINNRVLPDPLKHIFKTRDTEQSRTDAEVAQIHTDVASTVQNVREVPASTAARYLANTVPALADILLDEDGQLWKFADDDPEEETAGTDISANVDNADAQAGSDDVTLAETKDYNATWDRFTSSLLAVFTDANDGEIANRRRAGTIIRSIIARDGRQAMIDGLATGGVEVENLDDDDEATYRALVAENSLYVSDLTARIWEAETPMSEAQIEASVNAWANKTLQQFNDAGLLSADRDGLYEFTGDDGERSCPDCQRLQGKKFRLKDWEASGYMPSSPDTKLACKGFQCQHYLEKATGRANSKNLIGL